MAWFLKCGVQSTQEATLVASRGHSQHLVVLFLVLLFCVTGAASPARAQGIGFQGGASIDPEQVYVGSHLETREIARGLYFRPGIDGGFGSGLKLASINVEFLYKYDINPDWKIYQGGGPAVHIFRVGTPAQTDVTGGLNAVFGFAHDNGLFFEFKVGSGRAPNLKFGVGFTVH
jgi:hypothetical protein